MKKTFLNYFNNDRLNRIKNKKDIEKRLKDGLFLYILKKLYVGKTGLLVPYRTKYKDAWMSVEIVKLGMHSGLTCTDLSCLNRADFIFKVIRKGKRVIKPFKETLPGDYISYEATEKSISIDQWSINFRLNKPFISEYFFPFYLNMDKSEFSPEDYELFNIIRPYI